MAKKITKKVIKRRETQRPGKKTKRTLSAKSPRKKFVYFFGDRKAEGDRGMRDLLGGKGANCVAICRLVEHVGCADQATAALNVHG